MRSVAITVVTQIQHSPSRCKSTLHWLSMFRNSGVLFWHCIRWVYTYDDLRIYLNWRCILLKIPTWTTRKGVDWFWISCSEFVDRERRIYHVPVTCTRLFQVYRVYGRSITEPPTFHCPHFRGCGCCTPPVLLTLLPSLLLLLSYTAYYIHTETPPGEIRTPWTARLKLWRLQSLKCVQLV